VFGVLGGTTPDTAEATSADVEQLLALMIDVRARARAEKQWALSDLIRNGLRDIGFVLEDGKSGTTWKRA
jgi:cysteinyl-tRNA synthetase